MTRASSTTRWWWMWAAVAWTAFVWVGRIRNALSDDTLSTAGLRGALAMSAISLGLAAAVAVWAVTSRRGAVPRGLDRLVTLTFGWTVVIWVLRIGDIVLSGRWGAAFIVVHTTLGVLAVVLWGLARATRPRTADKSERGSEENVRTG